MYKRHNTIKKIATVLCVFFVTHMGYLQACQSESKGPPVSESEVNWQYGTVQHFTFEGGFYGIITDQGKKLLPINLPKNYHSSAMSIKIKGKLITDIMTVNQWGTPFEITEIVPVDK
jgi:hypothetical protein